MNLHNVLPRIAKAAGHAVAVGALAVAAGAHAQWTTYNGSVLTVPLLRVDNQFFSNAKFNFPIGGAPSVVTLGTALGPSVATPETGVPYANTAKGKLSLPVVTMNGAIYSKVDVDFSPSAWTVTTGTGTGGVVSSGTPSTGSFTFPMTSTIDTKYATDTGGELTYPLDNGTVWKIVADEPCMPSNAAPASEAGRKATVYIWKNLAELSSTTAGYRFMAVYTDTSNFTQAETCVVTPVYIPGGDSLQQVTALATTPATITVKYGNTGQVAITGGVKPYFASLTDPTLAQLGFLSSLPTGYDGEILTVQGVKSGTATIVLQDSNLQTKSIALTVGNPAGTALALQPTATLTGNIGDTRQVLAVGGFQGAGYTVVFTNPKIASFAGQQVTSDNTTILSFNLNAMGTTAFVVSDPSGQSVAGTITVNAGTNTGLSFTAQPTTTLSGLVGGSQNVLLNGGVQGAGFTVVFSNPGIASVGTVTPTSTSSSVMTFNFVAPGSTNFVISDPGGNTVSGTITVYASNFYVSPSSMSSITAGNSIDVTMVNGTPPFTYRVLDPSIFKVDQLGSRTFRITIHAGKHDLGNYYVTFFDANGNGSNFTFEKVTASADLAVSPNSLGTIYTSGTAQLYVSGGTPPYRVVMSYPTTVGTSWGATDEWAGYGVLNLSIPDSLPGNATTVPGNVVVGDSANSVVTVSFTLQNNRVIFK